MYHLKILLYHQMIYYDDIGLLLCRQHFKNFGINTMLNYEFKLKKIRASTNIKQSDLAAKLNVTTQTVGRWERGEVVPDIKTIIKLADIFSVSLDAIWQPIFTRNQLREHADVIDLFQYVEEDEDINLCGHIGIKLLWSEKTKWFPVNCNTYSTILCELRDKSESAREGCADCKFISFTTMNGKVVVFDWTEYEKVYFVSEYMGSKYLGRLEQDWELEHHEDVGVSNVLLRALANIRVGDGSINYAEYPDGYKDVLYEWLLENKYLDSEGFLIEGKLDWVMQTEAYYKNGKKIAFKQALGSSLKALEEIMIKLNMNVVVNIETEYLMFLNMNHIGMMTFPIQQLNEDLACS